MENNINIIISGTFASGKTILASKILNLLVEQGVAVTYGHTANDNDFPSQGSLEVLKNKGTKVNIIETNIKTPALQEKIDFPNG